MPKKSNEQGSQELLMEYEYLRQEISAIDNQIRQLQEHHESLMITRESVLSIGGNKDNELLVPAALAFTLIQC